MNSTQTLQRVWAYKWVLRSLLFTIYFNFHYLPFKQAVYLPILLYKPKFRKLKGKIVLNCKPRFGLVKLGNNRVSIYPNNGIVLENHGGTIIFDGKASIGNDSYISVHKDAQVRIGDDFSASAGLKLVCAMAVTVDRCVALGWGCLLTDTNFHPVIHVKDETYNSPKKEITIGEYC